MPKNDDTNLDSKIQAIINKHDDNKNPSSSSSVGNGGNGLLAAVAATVTIGGVVILIKDAFIPLYIKNEIWHTLRQSDTQIRVELNGIKNQLGNLAYDRIRPIIDEYIRERNTNGSSDTLKNKYAKYLYNEFINTGNDPTLLTQQRQNRTCSIM